MLLLLLLLQFAPRSTLAALVAAERALVVRDRCTAAAACVGDGFACARDEQLLKKKRKK